MSTNLWAAGRMFSMTVPGKGDRDAPMLNDVSITIATSTSLSASRAAPLAGATSVSTPSMKIVSTFSDAVAATLRSLANTVQS